MIKEQQEVENAIADAIGAIDRWRVGTQGPGMELEDKIAIWMVMAVVQSHVQTARSAMELLVVDQAQQALKRAANVEAASGGGDGE